MEARLTIECQDCFTDFEWTPKEGVVMPTLCGFCDDLQNGEIEYQDCPTSGLLPYAERA